MALGVRTTRSNDTHASPELYHSKMSLHAHKITQAAFKEALSRYPALIESFESTSGPSLKSLDEERLESIPEKVKAREQPHLKKEELQSVLSCKM